jgi:dienelactone hydrolase
MLAHPRVRRIVSRNPLLVLLILLTNCALACPAPAEVPAGETAISDVLVIGGLGQYPRAAVHTDELEYLIVTGAWTPPEEGTTVTLSDGVSRRWRPAVAEADGVIRDGDLAGGYAWATVNSEQPRVALLAAQRHSLVYVNGEPRVGDPYGAGYVRLPVKLERGRNELLFVCGRGDLRASLAEPQAPVAIDLRDSTLPDLLIGEPVDAWGAVVVANCRLEPLRGAALVAHYGEQSVATAVPPIPACGVRKVGFRLRGKAAREAGEQEIELVLQGEPDGAELARERIKLRARLPQDVHKRTFISDIDGSVQYYAVRPALDHSESPARPGLFLSLHGAGVEALGQAACYSDRDWGLVVAPTNRRPYGFDWEDWGRLDALEVLNLAMRQFDVDPARVYLTGHSMGGHGVWQIGATFPDRFAAIAPSAGWISFWSYSGAQRFENATPIEQILTRATNPSDTLALADNYLHYGVYVLHGEADDNVPVEQARTMRRRLGEYHPDFAYYERPGAGHWWGKECVDWPPLFAFLHDHTRASIADVNRVQFVTANPAVSATCDWATIEAQVRWLEFSRINLKLDKSSRRISGQTENVSRLGLSLGEIPRGATDPEWLLEPGSPMVLELDGQTLEADWPQDGHVRLGRSDGEWEILPPVARGPVTPAERDPRWEKRPQRAGPFKEAFRNRVQFLYGTHGSPEENAWAAAKARYDAETFWYRGNGSIEVSADTEFNPAADVDRNIILYGNSRTNAAWPALFSSSPIHIMPGAIRVAEQEIKGDNLAALAVYPRPGSLIALVGVVGGTGLAGMRLTDRLPVFVSGVAYPDWIVLGTDVLRVGTAGIRAAGFFGTDWRLDPEQSAWNSKE